MNCDKKQRPVPTIRCCKKCEQTKPIEQYAKNNHPQYPNTYRHICNDCNKQEIKEKNKRIYLKNRDKVLTNAKERYKKIKQQKELHDILYEDVKQPEQQPEQHPEPQIETINTNNDINFNDDNNNIDKINE